jgi:membrane dipeptidase
MIAAARKGGVIGMNGLGIFMSADGMDISPERLFAFLDYSVQLVGARHVGFGLDYIMHTGNAQKGVVATTGTSYKKGAGYHNAVHLFAAPSIIAEVVEIMLRHQYAEADVRAILGENWLRVFREVCG